MKHLALYFLLCAACVASRAQDYLSDLATNGGWGPNLSNTLFITYANNIYLQTSKEAAPYISPEVIEQARKSPESWPAKDFPEGNWGELTNEIQLSLRFAKASYTNGEPIDAIVLVRNTTNHFIYFEFSNQSGIGCINYLAWTGSNQPVQAQPVHQLVMFSRSGDEIAAGLQNKYVESLNNTFDLTNGNYFIQASITSLYKNEAYVWMPYHITSAKVPIEIRAAPDQSIECFKVITDPQTGKYAVVTSNNVVILKDKNDKTIWTRDVAQWVGSRQIGYVHLFQNKIQIACSHRINDGVMTISVDKETGQVVGVQIE